MPDPIVDPTYRYATQRFVLDGSTIDFNINFADGYISRDYVDCYYEKISDLSVEPIDKSLITWVSDDHIRIPDAASQPNTKRLLVKRWTEKGYALVNYTDDAIINEANLDKDSRQAIHDIAEMIDYLSDLNMKWESLNERVLDLLEQVNDALDAIQEAIDRLNNLKYTDLKDTPNTLQPNCIPLVNGAGTAIGWTDAASIVAAGGGGGAEAFTDLDDTPSSYTGQNNKLVVVSGSGLAFATASDALGAAGLDVVTEAPEDGKEYVRKDGAWAQASQADVEEILAATKKMEVAMYVYGRMQFDNEEVVRYLATRGFTIDAGLTAAVLQIAPLSNFILNIFKNGLVVGTITFNVGQLSGAVSIPSATVFNQGDILSLSTITGDVQAAGLSTTFACVRL